MNQENLRNKKKEIKNLFKKRKLEWMLMLPRNIRFPSEEIIKGFEAWICMDIWEGNGHYHVGKGSVKLREECDRGRGRQGKGRVL